MARALACLTVAIVGAGCGGFTFEIAIDPAPSITDIRVNGESVTVTRPQVVIDRSYADYTDARGGQVIVVELYAGDALVFRAEPKPGSCAEVCMHFECDRSELVSERIVLDTSTSYQPFEYSALHCSHADGHAETDISD